MNTYQTRLSRYRDVCREISLLSNQLKYLKSGAAGSPIRVKKIRLRLKLARASRGPAKTQAEEIIARVPEKLNMQEILRMRYIDCMRWQDISDCLELDQRWVLRLHRRALDSLIE